MRASASLPGSRRAVVIGAGLGGLAAAIRLQAGGIETVVVEARDAPGGRAGCDSEAPFRFCGGPEALSDRSALEELWALSGTAVEHDIALYPVTPLRRHSWPDGTTFDLHADEAELTREVARLAPGDLAGHEEYQRLSRSILADFRSRPGPEPFTDLRALSGMMSQLARAQAWRSLWSLICAHVHDERLREVLAVGALQQGANPLAVSALMAADTARMRAGLWWPQGGFAALAAALQKRFEQLGGTVRLGDPVCRVHTLGNRVHEIETQGGWKSRCDVLISTADRDHTWRDLLAETRRGEEMAARTRRQPHAPGLFTVHFALEGTWPGIPHSMALFGPRFRALIEDITIHGVLPQDQLIWLCHPSLTDPSLAPPGKSVFRAQVPVANLARLPIDWEAIGPLLEQRVLAEIGRRLVPDIRDRLITAHHITPRDLALDFNAAQGSGFGLAAQPLWHARAFHPLRDKGLGNLYFAGAAAAPGGGLPGALSSAKAATTMILTE
ncbi:phytoene desaturase family protein [Novosphingobium aquiterrae]|uniref:Phytoene desaturase family protein n=1 Tax=Novosphingobium aquiterrae TaxID=624388 RepID=A0ABV6PG96_9SPHN